MGHLELFLTVLHLDTFAQKHSHEKMRIIKIPKEILTKIIPISIPVDPIIRTSSFDFNHAHVPTQVPVKSPPNIIVINKIAPEQS